MTMKFTCTFTGIDASTDLDRVLYLSRIYPFIEWGVLFSKSRMGVEKRYPKLKWIQNFQYFRTFTSIRQSALHICGDAVRDFMFNQNIPLQIAANYFERIQLNFNVQTCGYDIVEGLDHVNRKINEMYDRIIFQYNDANAALLDVLYTTDPTDKCFQQDSKRFHDPVAVNYLLDASGGTGKLITDFTIPKSAKTLPIGFAGGIGPDNIADIFPQVIDQIMSLNTPPDQDTDAPFSTPSFWIDMESSIRTVDGWGNDNFDLDKVEYVCNWISRHVKRHHIDVAF
jgi:hypothetical protein